MSKRPLSIFGKNLGASSWPAALVGMVVIKAVLSLAVKPGPLVVSYSGFSYLLLLILASCFAIRNAIRNVSGGRFFWSLLAIGFGLWGTHESLQLYYDFGAHIEVPGNSIADPVLFLHVAFLIAAAITVPHSDSSDRNSFPNILNVLFVICVWILLYGYTVFPYQYLFTSSSSLSYDLRFDVLYFCENLALIAVAGFLLPRAQEPWKSICFNLLGASALYALSSTIANLAIDYLGGYVNGKLYGLGLTASVCWFVWIPLSAWQAPRPEINATEFGGGQDSQASAWAMLAVLAFSIPIVWELLKRNEDDRLRTLRVVFAVAMIVFLASAAYIKEYLGKRELASHFGLTNDRLHLALQAGAAVAWEWDVKSGRGLWFGDLQTTFGIPSSVYAGSVDQFMDCVHPDDRQQVSKALEDARETHGLFAPEFRIVRPDGSIRWLESRGKFYYARRGRPERIIGVSLDNTLRKSAEEALSSMTRKLIQAQEQERTRIARELHDDIGQRLALLTIQHEELEHNAGQADLRAGIQELKKQIAELASKVQALSHQLHSSKLEYLGLAAAAKGFCTEFCEHERVEVDFKSHDVPNTVSATVSLSLFRVLQQALSNAAKHSGLKRFEVHLWGASDEIHLTVSDLGKGFDVDAAMTGRGLGLTSMKERMRLIDGSLSIDSQPSRGTTIHACVPFVSGSEIGLPASKAGD